MTNSTNYCPIICATEKHKLRSRLPTLWLPQQLVLILLVLSPATAFAAIITDSSNQQIVNWPSLPRVRRFYLPVGLSADCQAIQCLMPAVMKSLQAGRLENRIPLTRPILILSVRNNHFMSFLILSLLLICFTSFSESLVQATSIKLLMLMCKERFSCFIENGLPFHRNIPIV